MGENEEWRRPPNGLLQNEVASVTRELDMDRWAMAEERTAELIARIQPNGPSEERRNAVASFVMGLIRQCFPCEVFTFGSVPLKTYLPDGDIDLTAFSNNQNLKDTWAHQVRDVLEKEERSENTEFNVKEVQYIQAEVKLIKCLVENIVVDISFNQLGGLCTLCFLEEVDHLINQNHLFKRSIILIKAWCYYESRLLGAHHGLISTYALETLVLYIFHVFNSTFAGPLEVLYRFLEFFGKFDWENFCVSLWGPVPINSLPDVTAEPPRKDGGELLLSKLFLDACSSVYSSLPPQENQGQPFVSKHFNIIDPLRINNNLGRSVSKGNFFRIRSAFALGAKRLARVLECPKEDIYHELNQFFMNTWKRHGSGHRPDAPTSELCRIRLSPEPMSENPENKAKSKKVESSSTRAKLGDAMHGLHGVGSRPTDVFDESSCGDIATSLAQGQNRPVSLDKSRTSDSISLEASQDILIDKGHRNSKPDNLLNDVQGKHLFARTRSSPELTDNCGKVSAQGRSRRAPESGRSQVASARPDSGRRKHFESNVYASDSITSSNNGPSPARSIPAHQSVDTAADVNSVTNSYHHDSGSGSMGDFASVVGTKGVHQEEQDRINRMASAGAHGYNGQGTVPLNLASGHLPFQISPPFLASMGYTQRNLRGIVPTDIPFIENPWGANMQFPPGLVSTPMTHYFQGIGLPFHPEGSVEPISENIDSADVNSGEDDSDCGYEQEIDPKRGYDLDNGSYGRSDGIRQSTSAVCSSGVSQPGRYRSSTGVPSNSSKEIRGSGEDDCAGTLEHPEAWGNEACYEDRKPSSRSFSAGLSSSNLKSKTPSESSWEGSTAKASRPTKEKRGRKSSPSLVSSTGYGKSNSGSEHSSIQAEEDNKTGNPPSVMTTERSAESVSSIHDPTHQMSGNELAQTIESDSTIAVAPVLPSSGTRQRVTDNSGALPFAFYPTGPPVPFVAMLPVYNFSSETGNTDSLESHFAGENCIDNSDSGQTSEFPEGLNQSSTTNKMRRAASAEPAERKPDILNGDFASHWQNLQFGRLCQNSRFAAPVLSPPMMVPPAYSQGPGRPTSTNANMFTQLMGYGSRLVPVAPLQSLFSRPADFYQHHVDEIPRYRSGTGTYLPNPKASVRDRHYTSTRRGSFNHDRSDHHVDREGTWNSSSRSRAPSRSQNRSQGEKPSSRQDRVSASENRAERPWGPNRHELFSSFQSQNGPIRGSQGGSAMYHLPAMNPNGISSNGPSAPSFLMLYPYDHNSTHGSPAELEFGSLGPVSFTGLGGASSLSDGTRSSGVFEEQRLHGGSAQRASPDQPSSPHFQG